MLSVANIYWHCPSVRGGKGAWVFSERRTRQKFPSPRPVEVGAGLFFPDVAAAQSDTGQTHGRLGAENAVPPVGPAVEVELDRAALARVADHGHVMPRLASYLGERREMCAAGRTAVDGHVRGAVLQKAQVQIVFAPVVAEQDRVPAVAHIWLYQLTATICPGNVSPLPWGQTDHGRST